MSMITSPNWPRMKTWRVISCSNNPAFIFSLPGRKKIYIFKGFWPFAFVPVGALEIYFVYPINENVRRVIPSSINPTGGNP